MIGPIAALLFRETCPLLSTSTVSTEGIPDVFELYGEILNQTMRHANKLLISRGWFQLNLCQKTIQSTYEESCTCDFFLPRKPCVLVTPKTWL